MNLGIKLFGPQTFIFAPKIFRAKIFDNATLECKISPKIRTLLLSTDPIFHL